MIPELSLILKYFITIFYSLIIINIKQPLYNINKLYKSKFFRKRIHLYNLSQYCHSVKVIKALRHFSPLLIIL